MRLASPWAGKLSPPAPERTSNPSRPARIRQIGNLTTPLSSYTAATRSGSLPFRKPKEASYVQGRRHRPRHHQLRRLGARGRRARRDPQRRGQSYDPLGRGVQQDGRGARRRSGEAPGDHEPRSHDPLRQAAHGHQVVDRHRRQGLYRPGDQRPHPAEAQARRRELPRRRCRPGRHHGARVLRRRPAPGDQGSRRDRRARSAAHHQRANRGRARVRPRQGRQGPDDPRLRPRRRYVRRVGARDRRRRVRGQVDVGQHTSRR